MYLKPVARDWNWAVIFNWQFLKWSKLWRKIFLRNNLFAGSVVSKIVVKTLQKSRAMEKTTKPLIQM